MTHCQRRILNALPSMEGLATCDECVEAVRQLVADVLGALGRELVVTSRKRLGPKR